MRESSDVCLASAQPGTAKVTIKSDATQLKNNLEHFMLVTPRLKLCFFGGEVLLLQAFHTLRRIYR